MANDPIVEIDDMDFNNFLRATLEVLEPYLNCCNSNFERFFSKANVSKKELRIHVEFIKLVMQAIKDQVVDIDEEDYVMISIEELARLKGE